MIAIAGLIFFWKVWVISSDLKKIVSKNVKH